MTRISKTKMDHWIVSGDWKSLEKKPPRLCPTQENPPKAVARTPFSGVEPG